jgi:hypothetical protein
MTRMNRGRGAVVVAAIVGGTSLTATRGLAAPPAAAGPPGPRDKVALRIDGDALGKDYLETNFIKAEKKLQQAIQLCSGNYCSRRVLAQLHRDLAVVHLAGLGKIEAGKADLETALEIDPDLKLDPDYATSELKKALDQLRGVKPGRVVEERKTVAKKGINHTAVSEQAVATPVPIFATFGGSESPKLRLWYKVVGAERWASVNMQAGTSGFTAEIPCAAAAAEGEIQYFIEALSETEATLEKDGSRTEPHTITIRKELEGEAPHLPDAPAPQHCKEICTGGDCGTAGAPAGKRPRNNWFSVTLQQDLSFISSTAGVCTPYEQVYGDYSCFRSTGSQYLGTPLQGTEDSVNGGLAPATTRVLVGFDRVLVAGLVLGVRLGYVLRGIGPRADGANANPVLPFHVEGRLAYWFGSDVFSTSGFRPFIFVAGGAAQVDTHFTVGVRENTSVPLPPSQIDNPPDQSLDTYRRMGQGFFGGGAGLMYAFTPGTGIVLDAKYMRMFPTPGDVLSPELGFALGF